MLGFLMIFVEKIIPRLKWHSLDNCPQLLASRNLRIARWLHEIFHLPF